MAHTGFPNIDWLLKKKLIVEFEEIFGFPQEFYDNLFAYIY